jgi:hypothetical protein
MKREYVIAYDVRVAGILSVVADSEQAALDDVSNMLPTELLKKANTETVDLIEDSLVIESSNELDISG